VGFVKGTAMEPLKLLDDNIILGYSKHRQYLALPEKIRQTHMHVVGASGRGKSKFLEHMIREDINNLRGLCLIDPHGHLYHDILRFLKSEGYLDISKWRDKIILLDPSSDEYSFGFNPLDFGSHDVSFGVDAMVKACAQVWGGEDTNATPLLKRCLRATFHALVEQNLSLLESINITTSGKGDHIHEYLAENTHDEVFKEQWKLFDAMSDREFREHFMSSNNRLLEFLSSPRIRHIIGQRKNTINFRKCMDEGKIVLVNLSSGGKLSDDNSRLLGTLLINDLFLKARERPKGSKPFYLYIDECALFVNEDIRRILDEARKFGLHLILAHQHLNQLKKAGDEVYSAVMTNAQTKVIFGGLTPDDARIMAEQIHMGEIDLQEAKAKFNKPTVVGHIRTWLDTYSKGISKSKTEGLGRAHTIGEGSGVGSSSGVGIGISTPEYSDTMGNGIVFTENNMSTDLESVFNSNMNAFTKSRVDADSIGESSSEGRHEALEPVYQILPGKEFSLEEQIYKFMNIMINQPTQKAIFKLPLRNSISLNTPNIPDISENEVSDDMIEECKISIFKKSPCVSSKSFVKVEIKDRRDAFTLRVESAIGDSNKVKVPKT